MDLQAALGIHQLARVDANWERRQRVWNRYQNELSGLPVGLPADPNPGDRHAYHLYTILVAEGDCHVTRDEFLQRMNAAGIGTGVHYLSIPEHPYYQETFGWRPEQWPAAAKIGRQTVSLPLSAKLSDADIDRVVRKTTSIVEGG
jgi:dTDP-4-amino-4,6-dideoxygalactose transaminase